MHELRGISIVAGEDELVVTRILDEDDGADAGNGPGSSGEENVSGSNAAGTRDAVRVGQGTSSMFSDYRHPERWSADDLQALVKLFPLEFDDFCRRTSQITTSNRGLPHEARAFLFLLRYSF